MPNPEPTQSLRVSDTWTRRRPAEGSGSSGRMSPISGWVSVGVEMFESSLKFAEINRNLLLFVGSDQILKRSGQISTRSQRISMRSQQISKRSGQISTRSHWISTTIMMHVTTLLVSNPNLREKESSFRSCCLE